MSAGGLTVCNRIRTAWWCCDGQTSLVFCCWPCSKLLATFSLPLSTFLQRGDGNAPGPGINRGGASSNADRDLPIHLQKRRVSVAERGLDFLGRDPVVPAGASLAATSW